MSYIYNVICVYIYLYRSIVRISALGVAIVTPEFLRSPGDTSTFPRWCMWALSLSNSTTMSSKTPGKKVRGYDYGGGVISN